MAETVIKITHVDQAQNFVNRASEVDGDVNVRRGVYMVDGKSIIGILSLDLTAGVTVEYPEDAHDFKEFLKELSI